MTQFVLNEREYVEKCLKYGKVDTQPGRTLALMAQYYYEIKKIRKVGIAELLVDFMKRHYKNYSRNPAGYNDMCAKIANRTGGTPLLQIKGVSVTGAEMETIGKIHDKQKERLAFTMLCIAKMNNARKLANNGWLNINQNANFTTADLFQAARIKSKPKERDLLIADLASLGLVELPKKVNNNNIRVTFIDEAGEQALFVSDFRELGYIYQQYRGANIPRCAGCGVLFPNYNRNDGKSQYCSRCAKKKQAKMKDVVCVDCGVTFQADARANQKCRCSRCQQIKVREDNRRRKQKQRSKFVQVTK